jgi:predicted ArsR family transcriptional regulator
MMGDEKTVEERLEEQREQLERRCMQRMTFLLDGLEKRLGSEAVDAVSETIAEATREQWAGIAQEARDNRIEDLVQALWEPLREMGFEFTVEQQKDGVQMRCTRCPLSDQAHEVEATKWGYHLYCATDPHIVAGFNPQIGFRRTKTLMEGDDCCDHFYYYLEDSGQT